MAWGLLGKSRKRPSSLSLTRTRSTEDASHAEHPKHKPLPFIASPVDPEALKWASKKNRGQGTKATSVAQFESEQTESSLAQRIFRKQHEASSLELFFDLFFVANLAIFTTRSAHMDLQSLSNYIGFFAILWTTWFHISMYDVRFYVDSIFTRICKFLCFGIMVSLVGLGSLYDAVLSGGESRSFHGIALLMFAARMLWVIQYGVVLFFVRGFDKTLLPMCLTILVYVASGLGFLATYIRDRQSLSIDGMSGAPEVRIWYGVICGEACAIIIISMVWRILSFKHTHLVERLSLLSLIIMGEGIIGLVKSTSYTIQGTDVSIWKEAGIAAAGILLIYLIYILYFDNIDHHGFGTVGQQLWTLLHFPTHVAILLTVEGSTALLLWYACRCGVMFTQNALPNIDNPKGNLADNAAFVAQVQKAYNDIMTTYKYKDLTDYYPNATFTSDLAKLQKTNSTFGTPEWSKEVGVTLKKMSGYFQYFIYSNFGAEGPVYKLKKEKDYGKKAAIFDQGYRFVLIYYYISAGVLLFLLAGLIMFGKKRKTGTQWWSIAIRIFAGICIPVGVVSPFMEKPGEEISFRYTMPEMLIPIVSFGLLLVVIVDNIAKALSEKHYSRVEERRLSRMTSSGSAPSPTKKGFVSAEHREISEEDSSYELHRNPSFKQSDIEHGQPEYVDDHDRAPLTQNMEGGFSGIKPAFQGYARVDQEEEDMAENTQRRDWRNPRV